MRGNYACDNSMRHMQRAHQNLPVTCSQAGDLLQALPCLLAVKI